MNTSSNQTFSGTITGTGSFYQLGSGNATLSGALAGQTGSFIVNAGSTLVFNGRRIRYSRATTRLQQANYSQAARLQATGLSS